MTRVGKQGESPRQPERNTAQRQRGDQNADNRQRDVLEQNLPARLIEKAQIHADGEIAIALLLENDRDAEFVQVLNDHEINMRVWERGSGETLACGTGACAAVASGIRLGLLDPEVQVDTRGGRLTIAWSGQEADSVFMTGPATTVFEGQIDIPDTLV